MKGFDSQRYNNSNFNDKISVKDEITISLEKTQATYHAKLLSLGFYLLITLPIT